MNESFVWGPARPTVLAFRGPDAVRFLNGQITQDVRRVLDGELSLPACVTDAKGKLRYWIEVMTGSDGALRVVALDHEAAELEAALTRYLIADDVEVEDESGRWECWHACGAEAAGVEWEAERGWSRKRWRFGGEGVDFWVPAGTAMRWPEACTVLAAQDLETLRIRRGIPAWGAEITAGMLPPEAGLEESAISYTKGCYIGQEVISRMKSAGKVNRRLSRLQVLGLEEPVSLPLAMMDADGRVCGEITSLEAAAGAERAALGFLKRGAEAGPWRVEGHAAASVERVEA